jgi:hypothetical protein
MLTDAPPRKANRAGFLDSDQIRNLELPRNETFTGIATTLESAMKDGTSTDVRFWHSYRRSTRFPSVAFASGGPPAACS